MNQSTPLPGDPLPFDHQTARMRDDSERLAYTCAELAKLQLPGGLSERGWLKAATRSQWPFDVIPARGGKGGVKRVFYPPIALLQVIRRHAKGEEVSTLEVDEARTQNLSIPKLKGCKQDSVGRRVAEVRGTLSQAAFAKRLGVHKNTVGTTERGESVPGGEYLQALYQEFGVSPTWVLTGQEPKYARPAAAVGALMSDAMAKSKGFTFEQQLDLGVDDDTFCAYLSGARMPDVPFLERFSALTSYPLDRLLARCEMGEAMATVEAVASQLHARKFEREQATGLADYEQLLIDQYRDADEKGKYLIECACAAVTTPTLNFWMRLGQAMADASNAIEKKR